MKLFSLALLVLSFTIQIAAASETVIIPGTTANPGPADHMWLQTLSGGLAPASVCYTSDGNGNIIPIPAGSGGGGSSFNLINPNGNFAKNSAIGTTAITFAVPSHAIGFILEATSSNTVNLRWAVGATATTTSGMRLEAGRDTGYVPVGNSVSVIAESGSTTEEATLQWILNQ